VNRPGNYYVTPNTPLATVIEMAGGFTSRAYVYGTKFFRNSVRAQQRESFREAVDQMETVLTTAPLSQDRSAIDASERQAQLAAGRAFIQRLRATEPDGRLVLDLTPYATSLPGNLLLENNDRIIVPPRVDTVGVFGAVYRPASFLINRGGKPRRVRDYVEQAGGPIRAADKANVFVVRANGEVLTKRRGALSAHVLPGDVIFVPIKTRSYSLLAKLRDITQILFQLGLSAAAVAAIQ
jgi:protein involved in polysaccharide export with SLBB domain